MRFCDTIYYYMMENCETCFESSRDARKKQSRLVEHMKWCQVYQRVAQSFHIWSFLFSALSLFLNHAITHIVQGMDPRPQTSHRYNGAATRHQDILVEIALYWPFDATQQLWSLYPAPVYTISRVHPRGRVTVPPFSRIASLVLFKWVLKKWQMQDR